MFILTLVVLIVLGVLSALALADDSKTFVQKLSTLVVCSLSAAVFGIIMKTTDTLGSDQLWSAFFGALLVSIVVEVAVRLRRQKRLA